MEHTGATAIEKPFQPIVLKPAEILEGVGMESAPELKGYVKFIAKPFADVILSIEKRDPLLARWQYGLGRSAVFTSDAKARWAAQWVNWKGFDRFWANLVRDLLPHSQAGEANVEHDSANGDLIVEYRLGRHVPSRPPFPTSSSSARMVFSARSASARLPRGLPRPGAHRPAAGLFRIRPLANPAPSPRSATTARRRNSASTARTNGCYGRWPSHRRPFPPRPQGDLRRWRPPSPRACGYGRAGRAGYPAQPQRAGAAQGQGDAGVVPGAGKSSASARRAPG